jgi:hypothetical protein
VELVGVYVYGRDKVGKDAGEIATDEVEVILALEADVVIHAARLAPPYGSHNADLARPLAARKT